MEWNYTLDENTARGLYTQAYQRRKGAGRLTRAMGTASLAVALWVAAQAADRLYRGVGFAREQYAPATGAAFALVAALLAVLAVWCLWRSTAKNMAAGYLQNQAKRGRPAVGAWTVRLDEAAFVQISAGGQEASDPSVIQKAEPCAGGLLVWLYGGQRFFAMPAAAFDGPEGLAAAAAEFERCSALARSSLYERKAKLLAQPDAERPLPPRPPLPQGETEAFAAPLMLRPAEAEEAFWRANRALFPVAKWRIALCWVVLVLGVLEFLLAGATGDWLAALLMALFAAFAASVLWARSGPALRAAVKKQMEGEQLVRLTTPGWLVLGQKGYTATAGALCSYRPYGWLDAVGQDDRYIFLRFEGNLISAVPKRGFESPAQAAQAFAFLKARLAESRKK